MQENQKFANIKKIIDKIGRIYSVVKNWTSKHPVYLNLIKIGFTCFFIWILSKQITAEGLRGIKDIFNLKLFLLTITITFVVSIVYVYRFYTLVNFSATKISFWKLYLINRAGNFFNFFLVGGFGQELSRIIYVPELKKKDIVICSFFDRFMGLLPQVIIFLILGPHFYVKVFDLKILFIVICAILLAILIAMKFVYKRLFNTKRVISVFSFSILYSVGLIFISKFQFLAVGQDIPYSVLFFTVPAVAILTMLPISVDGIGVREVFLVYALGLGSEKIIAYTLIGYIIYILLSFPGLFFFLRIKKKN